MLKRLILFLVISMIASMPLVLSEATLSPERRQETIMLEGMEEK